MFLRAGHLALRVPDIEASIAHATRLMGMRMVERVGDSAYLTLGSEHHSLQLIAGDEVAVDHMAYEVGGPEVLDELRERLEPEDVELLDEGVEEGIEEALRFIGPGGHVFEAYHGMARDQPAYDPSGVRPKQFGHFTATCADTAEMRAFAERVLGFQTSDVINTPAGDFVFMRCSPLHHALAVAPGGDGFHHYAWQGEGIGDLERVADLLDPHDTRLIWGPGRHGPGNNLFTYHLDPAGAIVEYFADMEIVVDDRRPVGEWPDAPRTMNIWGPLPAEDFLAMGIPIVDRSKRSVAATS